MRIETAAPSEYVDAAGSILQEAWHPPCLHYSPEYLRWEFAFPGAVPALGMMGFEGEEPVGFAAAVPRRLRFRDTHLDAYLTSFFACRPSCPGPYAVALVRSWMRVLKDTGLPLVSFVIPDSVGHDLFMASTPMLKMPGRSLGMFRTYGCLAPQPAATNALVAELAADDEEFISAARSCGGAGTLWNAPDRAQLRHYRADPRGRALVLIRRPDGRPVGGAMVIRSEIVTAQGVDFLPAIDSMFLAEPSADALRAVLDFAAGHYRGRVSSPVITAPNLQGVDAALLRSAGLRATSSCFHGHLFVPDAATYLLAADGTNLEIV
jgi:hypothetical protein